MRVKITVNNTKTDLSRVRSPTGFVHSKCTDIWIFTLLQMKGNLWYNLLLLNVFKYQKENIYLNCMKC